MQLSEGKWIDLLSKDYLPAREKVIIVINRLGKTLRIKKDDWQHYFSGFSGIGFREGREIEIINALKGGLKSEIPDWVNEKLKSRSDDGFCITQRDGKYYLKRLQLAKQLVSIPVCLVEDKFENEQVERTYWNQTGLNQFTYEIVDKLLSAMPKFKYDPIAPFKDMEGRLGFLGRKEFFGGFKKSDKEMIENYKREICRDQQDDGSWEQSATHTAFKLIRLLEVGSTIGESAVEKAVKWLINAREPLGMPGLFMYSEKTADSFNAWKKRQEPKSGKRGSRISTPAQRRFFIENQDVFGSSNAYCELKLTWSTAVVLEALLRCGLHEELRVVKAINTLLSISGGSGGWCGCGYFTANIYRDESTEPPDFSKYPIRLEKRNVGSVEVDIDEIMNLRSNHLVRGYEIGKNQALMTRIGDEGSGDCALVVHRALSYHPKYHGSNLETMLAIHCSQRQGWLGDWTGNYVSFFLNLLSRAKCPLSAFMVLRTVPLLMRQQREDGFWREEPLRLRREHIPVPTKEESTFMIASALKAFGFLDSLICF